jgi:uncharacterized protein YkwD
VASAPQPSVQAPQAPQAPDASCKLPDFRAAVLARINVARASGAQCGAQGRFAPAGAVAWNNRLMLAAQDHSRDMAASKTLSHASSDGRGLRERVEAVGYRWAWLGENVAAGDTTVEAVMVGWLASPPHCANLLHPRFTEVGVACVAAPQGAPYPTFWTMKLAAPR